jgi:hypothetical protein
MTQASGEMRAMVRVRISAQEDKVAQTLVMVQVAAEMDFRALPVAARTVEMASMEGIQPLTGPVAVEAGAAAEERPMRTAAGVAQGEG